MANDTDGMMREVYKASLEAAERELAGMDERRAALQATIAGLRRLLADENLSLGPGLVEATTNGNRPPAIPPRFFKGKTPTQAYRDLMRVWPREYSPPEIRDAFLAGGMEAKSKTALLSSVHSVLRRERKKAQRKRTND